MISTTQTKIKPNPLPLFAWAIARAEMCPRERIRWTVDRFNRVEGYRREVLNG